MFASRRPHQRRLTRWLYLERLEDRTLLDCHPLTNVIPLTWDAQQRATATGSLPATRIYSVHVDETGRLSTRVHATGADTRLALLEADGDLLLTSDGESATNRDDRIDQHVLPGRYYLEVTGLGAGTGTYTLTTEFHAATPPHQPLPVDFFSFAPGARTPTFGVTGDFNGDGHLDMATANTFTSNVSLLLGLGDGTFEAARNIAVGPLPVGIAAGDFNRDGRLDLATGDTGTDEISVLLGLGDGSFASERRFAGGSYIWELDTADLNGDGFLDLVSANQNAHDVSVLLGRGDGTFQDQLRIPIGALTFQVDFGDFNDDGHLDLVVSAYVGGAAVLLGRGDGTFQAPVILSHDYSAGDISTGDFNGDGRLDLALTNAHPFVVVFLGRGDGTFRSPQRWATGPVAYGLIAADLNGDGRLDLATANRNSNDASVLLGNGDGTFQDQVRFQVGLQPIDLLLGDFNGDGRPDLVTVNAQSHDLSLLLGLGDGRFELNPSRQFGADNPQSLVTADFNHDGSLDLVTTSYTSDQAIVFLGRGDGTFHPEMRFQVGSTPFGIVTGDFNADGHPDLATANCSSVDVSILLGRGDGTFADQGSYSVDIGLEFVLAGDFNGDGRLDLLTGGQFGNRAAVLLGRGDGTFTEHPEQIEFAAQDPPYLIVTGDFNRDGRLDLAATHVQSADHAVSVYLGRGDGTFQAPRRFTVGSQPYGLVTGDFNGDGFLDLANTNAGAQSVSLLLGRGDGTFQNETRSAMVVSPESLVAGDFNADGRLDLAATSALSPEISVLFGRGDGTFEPEQRLVIGRNTSTSHIGIVAADFNADGRLDLATPQLLTHDVVVLLGAEDRRFRDPLHLAVGFGPAALVTGDFNADGRLDVAGVHPSTNEVAVAAGKGDATLQDAARFAVGLTPVAVLRGDFNRDGRLDLATVNFASNDVSVLLGLGDGTFRPELRFAVGRNPTGLVAGDFNSDGRLDLAATNAGSNDVSVLLGLGDGTFQNQVRLAAPDLPQALVAADFNGDGRLDLATANYRSGDVAVFLGRGNGTFRDPVRVALGTAPIALQIGDLNGDGRVDLVTANYRSNNVAVLLGRGDGTFQNPVYYAAGANPLSVLISDIDSDGRLDLATANNNSHDVTLLLGRGDGTFANPVQRALGEYPSALVAADFNGDDQLDLAVGTQLDAQVTIFQALGNLTFAPGGTLSSPLRSTPLVADWNGDGAPDMAVINREGKILLRLARPGTPGVFEAPVIVNPDPHQAVRELALVATGSGFLLAALDARSSSVSFYTRGPGGTFIRSAGPTLPGSLPVGLTAGDLNGDGRNDLVVASAGAGKVYVYLQAPARGSSSIFGTEPDIELGVGVSPSAVALADVDGDGRLDIVVTNQSSGDVSVLLDPHPHTSPPEGSEHEHERCTCELRFRAGTGLYGLDNPSHDVYAVRSRQAPASLVAGHFDADNALDLIVTLSGSNGFSVLRGSGAGGFLNPARATTFLTGLRPTLVVVGQFNADSYLDLAILNEGSADLSIFLGDGQGGFTEKSVRDGEGNQVTLSAGREPTGLSVGDVNGDGRLDLLVGNDFGDVLTLLGNGDGSFQPYQRVSRNIALAVADLNGDGRDDFIFGNEALDRVRVQYSQVDQRFEQDRRDGLLAPGALKVADLNHDGLLDLVIANSGANNVLVYLGIGQGQFGPARSYFAGTNPVGLTLSYLNDQLTTLPVVGQGPVQLGDPNLDLVVANQGSNDITVLLGQGQGATWTFRPGPRLQAGSGPVATVVQDVTGPQGIADGIPDILTANSQANSVALLPAVGGGFFNDRSPTLVPVGTTPGTVFVGNFDTRPGLDLVTLNRGSNDLTLVSNFTSSSRLTSQLDSGGERPVDGLAGDFSGDGILDLVVAHNGDGRVALLTGGSNGLSLAQTLIRGDLEHPSALALGLFNGEALTVYVSGEGQEAVTALTFLLSVSLVVVLPVPGDPDVLTLPADSPPRADLVSLTDSALTLVATLLTVPRGPASASADVQPDVLHNSAFLSTFLLTPASDTGTSALNPEAGAGTTAESGGGEEEVTDEQEAAPKAGLPATVSSWVIGLEEAFERSRQAARARMFPAEEGMVPAEQLPRVLDEVFRTGQQAFRAMAESAQRTTVEVLQSSLAVIRSVRDVLFAGESASPAVGESAIPGEERGDSLQAGDASFDGLVLVAAAWMAGVVTPPRWARNVRFATSLGRARPARLPEARG